MKKINFTFNRILGLCLLLVLVVDIIYTVSSPAYKEYNKLLQRVDALYIEQVDRMKEDLSKYAISVETAHTNFTSRLDAFQNYYSNYSESNYSRKEAINHSSSITESATTNRVDISDYNYGVANGIPHCLISGHVYYVGDNYIGERINYLDRWGFTTEKTMYVYKSPRKEVTSKTKEKEGK